MTSEIRIVGEFTINEGKTEAFKELIKTAIETVRSNEPDTLRYEFYFNEDETACYPLELFRNSQAVLTHLEDVGAIVSKLSEVAQITRVEIYGNASDELKQALAPFGAKFFKHWGGFTR